MAYQNVDQLNLGLLLQIVFSDGVRNQISNDYRDWELIKRAKVGSSLARELRFTIQKSFGPAAIQYRNPGVSGRAYPTAQQISTQELTAKFKEIEATIELEYSLWDRARKTPQKYAEPLALEIQAKSSASKKRLAADLYGDGTGVIGTIDSASISSGQVVITLSNANSARGHVGFFEYYDNLIHYDADGTAGSAVTLSSGTFSHWQVRIKDRINNQVTLQAIDTTGAEQAVSVFSPVAGELFYRIGQGTIPDLTGSIADYALATEVMAGLESLTANDGRVVHGMTMSGPTAGTRMSAGGNAIDTSYIQRLLSQVKTAVGGDRYTWKMMNMAPETFDALMESAEPDRRFGVKDDPRRGGKTFTYQHQNDSLECYTSEYIGQKRIWLMPEAKTSEKVLEYHGSDFEPVKAGSNDEFRLKSGANGYVNAVVSYLFAVGVLICKHPAAIGVLEDFTNS